MPTLSSYRKITRTANLSSIDRFFSQKTEIIEADRYRDLLALSDRKMIAQGAGVSYVAAGFGKGTSSVKLTHFNRIINWKDDILEVEAGASIGKLYNFLVPRGWILPVQPGHPQITIGGCIGLNIHGKNQFREGLFGDHVIEMKLFHPDRGIETIQKHHPLFDLTLGGFGLTGIVLSLKIKLKKQDASHVVQKHLKVSSLQETYHALIENQNSDLLYSWNELSSFGKNFGRGFLIIGDYVRDGKKPSSAPQWKSLTPHAERFRFPLFKTPLKKIINPLYYFQNTSLKKLKKVSFFEYCYPVHNKIFYFDSFGKNGFIEMQMLIQHSKVDEYLPKLETILKKEKIPITLTSCKLFKGEQKFLNYNGTGLSLSIDVANTKESRELCAKIDRINIEYGVMSNIAKDSRISEKIVASTYPYFNSFKEKILENDPQRRFNSEVSERIGLSTLS